MDSASDLKSSPKTRKKRSKATSSSRPEDHRVYSGTIQPEGFPPLPEGWVSEWETFEASDHSLKLFGVLHLSPEFAHRAPGASQASENDRPIRALIISHGLWEHGGRYLHFPHFLKGAVDAVYCLDHRGHGRSEGLRGHVDRFDLFIGDLAHVIGRVHGKLLERFGRVELHVLGHSMGGLILLRTLFQNPDLPLKSATVSAPLLGIRAKVPVAKKLAGYALSRLWGSLQMPAEVDPSHLSHDPAVLAAHAVDRLIHNKVTPKLFTGMESALAETCELQSGIVPPLLGLLPSDDQVTDSSIAMDFFKNLSHEEKEVRDLPGFYHEPFNELEKEKAFEELKTWILKHSAKNSSA